MPALGKDHVICKVSYSDLELSTTSSLEGFADDPGALLLPRIESYKHLVVLHRQRLGELAPYTVQNTLTRSKTMGFFSPSLVTPPSYRAMGYLAFPPGGSPYMAYNAASVSSESEAERNEQEEEREMQRKQEEANRDAAWAARVQRDAELRQQRLAQEEAEARRGEEEWVRSGGILRDAEGRRDMVRTQAVREELKLRDIEKVLVEKWQKYEGRWKELLVNGKGKAGMQGGFDLRFWDIPWPVDMGEDEVKAGDLTVRRVEEFLLGGLKVRGCMVTRKERVRSSLLRWHPDKMTGVLLRVVEEDVEDVKEGINVVIRCLQVLNSKV